MICEQCKKPLEFLEVIFRADVMEKRCVGGHDNATKVLAHLVDIEPCTESPPERYLCGACHTPLPDTFNYDHWCEWAAAQSTRVYEEGA